MPLSKPGLHCMSPTPSRDKHLESQEDEPMELRATSSFPKGRTEPDQQREWAGRSWKWGGGGHCEVQTGGQGLPGGHGLAGKGSQGHRRP